MTNALAFVPQGWPSYKSQGEEDWATFGNMILADELGQLTNVQRYEPLTFHLPGNKYRPDFMHLLEDGSIVFVEVKMSKKVKNYRDSRSKLRAAAELHPWFIWFEARQENKNWILERI